MTRQAVSDGGTGYDTSGADDDNLDQLQRQAIGRREAIKQAQEADAVRNGVRNAERSTGAQRVEQKKIAMMPS